MEAFLQIVGLVALILVGALVVVIGGIFLWVRWQAARLGAEFKKMGGPAVVLDLRLEAASPLSWRKADRAKAAEKDLEALGYAPCGTYQSQAVPGLLVSAFVQPELCLYAVVCEHPAASPWIDLYQEAPNGDGLTVTNLESGGDVPTPEWSRKIILAGEPAARLHEEMAKAIAGRDAAAATPEGFLACFEGAYRRSMEWQMESGRVNNPHDISSACELTGLVPDAEAFAAAEAIYEKRRQSAREAFLAQSSLSAAEWDRESERTIFITEDDRIEALYEMLEDWTDGRFTPPLRQPKGPPIDAFPALLERAELEDQLLLIASLAEPVRCDVYRFKDSTLGT
jgi:hypothetical protein